MPQSFIWIAIGFISGSIPWALIIGKLFLSKDIRIIGDGNPGAVNAWKLSGPSLGMLSVVIEICKSLIPVFIATLYLGQPSGLLDHIWLSLVALAPIIGHGWSPFLRFKGGKALATSWGSWIAITNGMAFPVALVLLATIHVFQRNHAITVTSCLVGFMIIFVAQHMYLYTALFGISNILIVIHKHRPEYSDGILLRKWVPKLAGKLS